MPPPARKISSVELRAANAAAGCTAVCPDENTGMIGRVPANGCRQAIAEATTLSSGSQNLLFRYTLGHLLPEIRIGSKMSSRP